MSPDKLPHVKALLASRLSLWKQESVSTIGWLSHNAKGPLHEELASSGKGGTCSDSLRAGGTVTRGPGRGGGSGINEQPLLPALDTDTELYTNPSGC